MGMCKNEAQKKLESEKKGASHRSRDIRRSVCQLVRGGCVTRVREIEGDVLRTLHFAQRPIPPTTPPTSMQSSYPTRIVNGDILFTRLYCAHVESIMPWAGRCERDDDLIKNNVS